MLTRLMVMAFMALWLLPAAPIGVRAADMAPVAQLGANFQVADPCTGACAKKAAQERSAQGARPPAPRFRVSLTQSEITRQVMIKSSIDRGMSKEDAAAAFVSRAELVSDWKDSFPAGDYRADDLADVVAKFWMFSWDYGLNRNENLFAPKAQESVRAQTRKIVASDPGFTALSESQRQILAETLIRDQVLSWNDITASLLFADGADTQGILDSFNGYFTLDLSKVVLDERRGFVTAHP